MQQGWFDATLKSSFDRGLPNFGSKEKLSAGIVRLTARLPNKSFLVSLVLSDFAESLTPMRSLNAIMLFSMMASELPPRAMPLLPLKHTVLWLMDDEVERMSHP